MMDTQAATLPKRQLSILSADDSPGIRQLLFELLSNEGHHVEFATDGEQAIISARKKKYDLLILDVNMPKLDGYRAAQMLSAEQPDSRPKVLIFTARDIEKEKTQFLLSGADGIISKNLPISEIRDKIYKMTGLNGAAPAGELAPPSPTLATATLQKPYGPQPTVATAAPTAPDLERVEAPELEVARESPAATLAVMQKVAPFEATSPAIAAQTMAPPLPPESLEDFPPSAIEETHGAAHTGALEKLANLQEMSPPAAPDQDDTGNLRKQVVSLTNQICQSAIKLELAMVKQQLLVDEDREATKKLTRLAEALKQETAKLARDLLIVKMILGALIGGALLAWLVHHL